VGDFDLVSFFIVSALIGAVCWIVYWYAKKIGNGVAAHAFQDPHDRKRMFIFAGVVVAVAAVIFFGLWFTDII
jgi:undecaprenyl pyrophosphate phosphatase UppP